MAVPDPLEEIYREHAPALFRFLVRLSGNEAETKDILQEIFLRLAQRPDLLEGVGAPGSYLFRLAHRLAIDRHRRDQTRQRYEDLAQEEQAPFAAPVAGGADAAWLGQAVAASLRTLSPEQKAVVLLKIWEEMTFAEIAAVLDISVHTAASRYRYALDKLKGGLRPLQRDLHP
jgi:RNA polymerase sigma-70 factor (ECF subfamily)